MAWLVAPMAGAFWFCSSPASGDTSGGVGTVVVMGGGSGFIVGIHKDRLRHILFGWGLER